MSKEIKKIETYRYAIVKPDGTILMDTLEMSGDLCKHSFCRALNKFWAELEEQGYECIEVFVTIKKA